LKPFGFSLPGDFYDASSYEGCKGRKANVARGKRTEYPIWYKLRKAAGCFPCSQAQRHLMQYRPFVPLYRKFHREWKCLT